MQQVLEILAQEGPVEPSEIATRLDRPRDEVEALIRQAQEEGILLGYRALINWERADGEKIYAFISVEATPEHSRGFDKIADYVSHFAEVHSVYLMSGISDLTVVVEGSDFREIARFVAEKLAPIPGVRSTATSFVLKTYKMEGEIVAEEAGNHRLAVSP